jgi:hypothetical protein
MNQKVYSNILSVLTHQASFEIHFTPGWKGYEIRSEDINSDLVESITEWFYDEFIHTLLEDGLDTDEMLFQFSKDKDELILRGTFISYGHDYYRDDLYKFSDLIGEPIVKVISEMEGCALENVNTDDIQVRFEYSSKEPVLKDFILIYQDKERTLSNYQMSDVSIFLLNKLNAWKVGCGGMDKLENVFTVVIAEYFDLSVKTHGNASYKILDDSACLI